MEKWKVGGYRILVLILAFVLVSLVILSRICKNLEGAYYLALGPMVVVSILKIGFRCYYRGVM
ncbi:hypothetical protein EP1X_09690 [Thermococcus sp. EP1]|uniref:hypothetical protein n=1 Tax=Thermococcus sp. EP1 TaxID=1591054 RepID=UPI0006DAAF52|nr:hypothetical protein [Thermococcus sp. EP1]KPU62255.1 hypothetical protein EP1X_09690 [Thermococcus sp. EP1]